MKTSTKLLYYAAYRTCEFQSKRIIWRHFKPFFVKFHRHPVILRVFMQKNFIFDTQPLNNVSFVVLKFLSKRIITTPKSLRFITKNIFLGRKVMTDELCILNYCSSRFKQLSTLSTTTGSFNMQLLLVIKYKNYSNISQNAQKIHFPTPI